MDLTASVDARQTEQLRGMLRLCNRFCTDLGMVVVGMHRYVQKQMG